MLMRALAACVSVGLCLFPLGYAGEDSAGLTFRQRVEAQRAIEQVYHSHRTGSRKPFHEAVTREILEQKVRTYVQLSGALEKFWGVRITGLQVRAELERIGRNSHLPRRLEEIYQALGHDPLLIRECFVRPILIHRLARDRFNSDARIHAGARQEAERLRHQINRGVLDLSSDHPRRSLVEFVEMEEPAARTGLPQRDKFDSLELTPRQFARWRSRMPGRMGEISSVSDEQDAFVLRGVLSEEPGRFTAVAYRFPKRQWQEWWSEAVGQLDALPEDPLETLSVASAAGTSIGNSSALVDAGHSSRSIDPIQALAVTAATAAAGVCAEESWVPISEPGAPAARDNHTAVWTGSEMIVWGGFDGVHLDTGGRYDPLTDGWTPTSTVSAPAGRRFHTAIWSGTEMIVWGGFGGTDLDTGGRYSPLTDSWIETSTVDAPSRRDSHSAVWAGTSMIIWGGLRPILVVENTGGIYNPGHNTWTALPTTGAPSARAFHTAIWSGNEMIIWGGNDGTFLNTGNAYAPATNSWSPVPAAPVDRRDGHTAAWSGTEMIVWGGYNGVYLDSGGRYDPASGMWQVISATGAPVPRATHTAVWSGQEMIVWGGSNGVLLDTGGRYDPAADGWAPTPLLDAPSGRWNFPAVWSNSGMIVWGGNDGLRVDTGARYELLISTDGDLDGFCTTDCNDSDGQIWAAPGETQDLAFSMDGMTLSWSAPAEPGSFSVAYDTLRSGAPGDFGASATCVESNDSSDTSSIDGSAPAAGAVSYYLSRAENTCPEGQGSLGARSDGTLRAGRTCPEPLP